MAVFRSGFAVRRRGFLLLTLLAFALALGAGGLLWQSVESSSVSEVRVRIDDLKPVFEKFRLGLIAMLASQDGIHITGEEVRVDGGTWS